MPRCVINAPAVWPGYVGLATVLAKDWLGQKTARTFIRVGRFDGLAGEAAINWSLLLPVIEDKTDGDE
jgi:hypothetical protein